MTHAIAHVSPLLWLGFLAAIALLLFFDLGVLDKEPHGLSPREAIVRFVVWVALAAAFAAGIAVWLGRQPALEFAAGYLLEESLSVDNIFVIVLVFKLFKVPGKYHHRVLFWGIVGAVLLRGAMILGGTALIHRFAWLLDVFGAFLIFTGVRFFFSHDEEEEPSESLIVRLLRRVIRTSDDFDDKRFFTRQGGRWMATPLLLVLIAVELSDVTFALDSIPAIFGVTTDPFIVFTSNIFAILGLRTLYFLVWNMLGAFRYLNVALAVVLTFIGAKMIAAHWLEVPIGIALGVIALTLAIAVIASWLHPESPGEKKS